MGALVGLMPPMSAISPDLQAKVQVFATKVHILVFEPD
jgi:hypothetical protein